MVFTRDIDAAGIKPIESSYASTVLREGDIFPPVVSRLDRLSLAQRANREPFLAIFTIYKWYMAPAYRRLWRQE
jgi:hypothetical protein